MFDESKPTFGTFEDRAVWLIGKLLPDFPKWGVFDACACAGNLGRESGIQMIQEGGKTPPAGGWGLPQWTGERRTQFSAYCVRSGRNPNAMSTGYAYLFVELTSNLAHVIDLVAAETTLEAKTSAFEQHYEMAGVVAGSDRLAYAVRAQKAWEAHMASQPVPAPTTTPPPTTTPAPTTTQPPTKGTLSMGPFNIATAIAVAQELPTAVAGIEHIFNEAKIVIAKVEADNGDVGKIVNDVIEALFNAKTGIIVATTTDSPAKK